MSPDISAGVAIKNFLYIPAAVVGISMENMGVLIILLLFDIITGIWRSAAVEGGKSITSWRALNGFFSKFLFISVPITVAYMGHGIGFEVAPLVRMAMGVLILGTGYSILGNIYTIRTGKKVKEFDALQVILYQIQKLLDKYTVPPEHK